MTIKREDLATTDFGEEVTGERLAPCDARRRVAARVHGTARPVRPALAREMQVPVTRITEILNGERAVTAETALRLGRRFGTSPEFWLGLQAAHDLEIAREALGWAA